MPNEQTPWVVKGVPERIKRKVKLFAVRYDITMAQALEFLIDTALADDRVTRARFDTATLYLKGEAEFNRRYRNYTEACIALGAIIAELQERQRENAPLTQEEVDMLSSWEDANYGRIRLYPAYSDEYEIWKMHQERQRRLDEAEKPNSDA